MLVWDCFIDRNVVEVVRLEELRLSAVEGRIEADLRRGKAGELVGELESLRSMHPMRESFVGQLILALYQSGRQADALRTFERFQRHVGEELGIEPSPELRRLEEQVLLHDSRIRVRLPGVERVETVTFENGQVTGGGGVSSGGNYSLRSQIGPGLGIKAMAGGSYVLRWNASIIPW